MVEFLIASVNFHQCLRYGVIFYGSVQHDLETCQRPRFHSNFDPVDISKAQKLNMNDLKRPKYRNILKKLTKTIGRDEEL